MSLKKIFDALTKGPLIEKAFDRVEEIHNLTLEMFEKSFEVLINQKDEIIDDIIKDDDKIDLIEMKIRKEIFEYLAISSAPNLNASLILTAVIKDYERIGDISANIAQLNRLYPTKLEEHVYLDEIYKMKNNINEIFKLTIDAFENEDYKKAKNALKLHDDVKEYHINIIKHLNDDKDIETNKAICYALLSYYLRRINAHLANINTTVTGTVATIGHSDY